MLTEHIQLYLKTTETCQLDCEHCFTSGSKAPKIYFNPDKTIDWLHRFQRDTPVHSMKILFHGGEPMLAPLEDMYKVYDSCKNLFDRTEFGMQTNLVYKLTDEKMRFFDKVLKKDGFGTSWDYDIRFGSTKPGSQKVADAQRKLWEENVRRLIADGHYMTMIVSVTKRLIEEMEPIKVINYARDLGFQHILFERITHDGNAQENQHIFPKNLQIQDFFERMWHQSLAAKSYEYIGNMFLSEVAQAYVDHAHTANRCRICEQSLITINADGSIAGCPNTAPVDSWGHIDWDIVKSLTSKGRMEAIACESERNENCYTCDVAEYCNGDCQQLAWEGDICASPKTLFQHLAKEDDTKLYERMILR